MQKNNLLPKTNRGLKTKEKLLRSAEYVFGKNGYHQSSITEITQHAGVSLGNFYTYFESKYEIFESLLWEMQKKLIGLIRKRISGLENRIEIEREGIKALFEFVKERPHWYSLFPQAEFVNKELHRNMFEKLADSYISSIEIAIRKGEIKPLNPEVIVYSIMGITNYIGLNWILWNDEDIDDALLGGVMDLLKHGIIKQ
ncbi:TetR/AcrR family transcriptional regulator [Neobacillus niacini]|uniref:TetR/AcrR family transcriptional regulator n=1 Tax=Neobacillus niacini TaxID=86668 RepID=UPI0021CAEECF|nr:TetR/AcrR family transcriptional regulator [Neobacillus niacini]MCM3766163.1 TetR/AcrR family transcriptional regulator [Neobacillus niacini]